jgi:hypothetical protein
LFNKKEYSYTCAGRCSTKRWAECRCYNDGSYRFCINREKSETIFGHDRGDHFTWAGAASGGIKEKVLAAKRAGIKEIILCKQNEKDITEIDSTFIKGVKFHYVKTMKEVLDIALEP